MTTIPYLMAVLSGLVHGCLELLIAHRRMKWEAIKNPWGILYLIGNGCAALGVFVLISSDDQPLVSISSNTQVNFWAIAILSGPLIGIALRHIGGPTKDASVFMSYHHRIFDFLIQEVRHSVDVQRVELARQISESLSSNYDRLYSAALDFVEGTGKSDAEVKKERAFLEKLKKQGAGALLARYLIESYGAGWAKAWLMKRLDEKPPEAPAEGGADFNGCSKLFGSMPADSPLGQVASKLGSRTHNPRSRKTPPDVRELITSGRAELQKCARLRNHNQDPKLAETKQVFSDLRVGWHARLYGGPVSLCRSAGPL